MLARWTEPLILSPLLRLFVRCSVSLLWSCILMEDWTILFDLLVLLTLVRFIWAIYWAIVVSGLLGWCCIWMLNHTICLVGAFTGLLMITLGHIDIFMHIIAHWTPCCCTLPSRSSFVAILAAIGTSLNILLVGLWAIIAAKGMLGACCCRCRANIFGRKHWCRALLSRN